MIRRGTNRAKTSKARISSRLRVGIRRARTNRPKEGIRKTKERGNRCRKERKSRLRLQERNRRRVERRKRMRPRNNEFI